MDFAHPQVLNALYILPLVVLLFVHGARRRSAALDRFIGSRMRDALAPGASWRRELLKATLKTLAVTCMILAVARPQFGKQLVKVNREGIDLVVALDVSLSMMAEDMKPNRLERAKQEIVDLIQGLKGDRVGIVAFAGDAFVLCPLTVDYNAALMFTQTADVDIVSRQGTALDKAIETSLSLFRENTESDRVIIIVTDGEGHDSDPVARAREASARGVRIYTIGIGNPQGELIPLRGTDGGVEGYKKDSSGETVLTRLDERTLKEVARVTKGKYMPATREGLELKVLYREISGLQRSQEEGQFMERKTDRFAWFLGAAFVLLLLEALITRRATRVHGRVRRVLHSGATAALILLLAGGLADARAKTVDRDRVNAGNRYFESGEYQKALALYHEALGDTTQYVDMSEGLFYNEANTLHMMQKYKDALNMYHASLSEDSTQTGRMFYNRGNTLLLMGKPDEAIESYVQSLSYLPNDDEARYNLELALKMKQMQQQQQQNQDQQQNQKDQNQNQKDENQQQQQQNQDKQNDQQQQQNQDQQNQQQQSDSTQTQPTEPDSTSVQPQPQQSIQLTREDAMRILRLLEEQEKELQKAKRKAAMRRATGGKDW